MLSLRNCIDLLCISEMKAEGINLISINPYPLSRYKHHHPHKRTHAQVPMITLLS